MLGGEAMRVSTSCGQVGRVSSSISGAPVSARAVSSAGRPVRAVTTMGNKATTGPFAPLVRVARDVVGKKKFNQLRGKAISIHSNVIKEFCGNVGADRRVAQGVIRLAKKNGEFLGFLA
ncbi:hypothetical protein BSKO_06469 [Bryopsis sp. KO-2023]|nr:hypothetical protein BSKO_06469 [Bryopsis sp. KO-2023]